MRLQLDYAASLALALALDDWLEIHQYAGLARPDYYEDVREIRDQLGSLQDDATAPLVAALVDEAPAG